MERGGLGVRVKRGIHGDVHFLAVADDLEPGLLAGSEVVGGINEVLDRADLVSGYGGAGETWSGQYR